jgi:hypothetical protein
MIVFRPIENRDVTMVRNNVLISHKCRVRIFGISEYFAQKDNCYCNLKQYKLTKDSKDHNFSSKLLVIKYVGRVDSTISYSQRRLVSLMYVLCILGNL